MILKTGFENLDNAIGNLNKKDLIVIASRPNINKGEFAINIINCVSKQTKDNILYFNLELPKNRLKEKIINNNVEIVDTPRLSIEEIKSKCGEISKKGLSLVVIDYIQLVSGNIDNIIRTLKLLSIELNVPIIILYNLSKSLEERKDKRTILKNLRVSSVKEEADKIIYLYKEDELDDVGLIVVKNNNS